MSFFVIKGKPRDRLLKDHLVFVFHFLFFLLLQYLFRAVCHSAEDVFDLSCSLIVLGDALIVHVAPLTKPFLSTHVPAEDTFVGLCLSTV